jgi:multicomponent Na+:H+ antiporter subunit D
MLLAMGLAAVLCILIGTQPQYLYALLPWEVDYWPYDTTHVLAQLQLLFFAALAFVWMEIKGYAPPELHAVNIDAEWLYRKLLPNRARQVYQVARDVSQASLAAIYRTTNAFEQAMMKTRFGRFHLAGNWPTGSMVLWIAVILGAYLLVDAIH